MRSVTLESVDSQPGERKRASHPRIARAGNEIMSLDAMVDAHKSRRAAASSLVADSHGGRYAGEGPEGKRKGEGRGDAGDEHGGRRGARRFAVQVGEAAMVRVPPEHVEGEGTANERGHRHVHG